MFDHFSLFWWCRKINVELNCDDALSLGPCSDLYVTTRQISEKYVAANTRAVMRVSHFKAVARG